MFQDFPGEFDMAQMDRVEGASEDCQPPFSGEWQSFVGIDLIGEIFFGRKPL